MSFRTIKNGEIDLGVAMTQTLNRSQVFTSSGNFTVPTGVTYLHVSLRGGDGVNAGYRTASGSQVGTAGGNTTFDGKIALGGIAGDSWVGFHSSQGTAMFGLQPSGQGPEVLNFYTAVTPGAVMPVVIGSGLNSYAVISWAV